MRGPAGTVLYDVPDTNQPGSAADRLKARNDFEINRKAEEEARAVLEHLSAQDEALAKIVQVLASKTNGTAQS